MHGRGGMACSRETSILYANCDSAKVPFKSRMSTARSVCVDLSALDVVISKELLKKAVSGMIDVVFWGVVTLQVLTPVLSFPNGAPASTCVDMMPRHGAAQPQPNPAPYTIQPSSTAFQSGQPITVVIKGPDYRGVLLEARSGSDTSAIGTWQTPPANTKFLACSGNAQGAITHSNTVIKNNSTVYTWIPPATAKSVFFMATVAQQQTVFWVGVKSQTLTQSGGGTSLDVNNSAERTATPFLMLLVVLLANVQCLVA